jgi:hypothetical protein
MADLIKSWLQQEADLQVCDLEKVKQALCPIWTRSGCLLSHHVYSFQDFANGYLFGKLLAAYNLQPDFSEFSSKSKPEACYSNYIKLQVLTAIMPPNVIVHAVSKHDLIRSHNPYNLAIAVTATHKAAAVVLRLGEREQEALYRQYLYIFLHFGNCTCSKTS